MPTIRKLPASVVNKIAAGEVIERPASVVKELVENALDAGARRIDVTIEQGGTALVRVTDDGCGIPAEELELAVASHATSKLATADDLFRVRTLGFRGEALASIAEVSHLVLRSCTASAASGAELAVVGGQVGRPVPCGCPQGTTVEVRNLFFNTPVRRKFLRSTQTEMGHVAEVFCRLALAACDRHFSLVHNRRLVYDLPPVSEMRQRIAALFGEDVARDLIAVESRDDPVRLWGYVGHPHQTRANNRMQYLFLNGRHIRDRSLQHALSEAYRGLIMTGRFPISFLTFEMPPELVDVNVHPTKLEVRFQDGGRLYSQLLGTLRTRFLKADLTHRLEATPSTAGASRVAAAPHPATDQLRAELVAWAKGQLLPAAPPAPAQGAGTQEPVLHRPTAPQYDEATHPAVVRVPPPLTGTPLRLVPVDAARLPAPPPQGLAESDTNHEAMASDAAVSDAAPAREQHRRFDQTSLPDAASPSNLASPAEATSTTSSSELADWFSHHPTVPAATTMASSQTSGRLAGLDRSEENDTASVQGTAGGHLSGRLPSLLQHPGLGTPAPADLTSSAAGLGPAAARPAPPAPLPTLPGRVAALQVHNRYLVAETEEGVLVIDQHALHERILYEQLQAALATGTLQSQRLLVPEPVDLTPAEAAAVLEGRELLTRLGLEVEHFGGDTVLVHSVPALLSGTHPGEMLHAMAERLISRDRPPESRDLLDRLLHQLACKAAVKAGDPLHPEEIAALLAHRHLAADAHHCPHGRPTALVLTRQELDKQFGRT